MSRDGEGHAESIRHRLRNEVRKRGEDVLFALQRYVSERFLYRLGQSAHRDRFVLKGAMLFALWGGVAYRPTRDLDFTGYGSEQAADVLAAFRDICGTTVPDDGLVFDVATLSTEPIRDDTEYRGLRVFVEVHLGRSRERMQVDIGFGDAVEPRPRAVEYPTLLGLPAPLVRAYPPEAVIAEKLHAMVLFGERNSRLKDFYDLHVLARHFSFEGPRLSRAISSTFARRLTSITAEYPVALTPRFYADDARGQQWRGYLNRSSLRSEPAEFAGVGDLLQIFLCPLWDALAQGGVVLDAWQPMGPWSDQAGSASEIASSGLVLSPENAG